jgi:hypothetical protein
VRVRVVVRVVGSHSHSHPQMRTSALLALLLLTLTPACAPTARVEGALSEEGSCTAAIDGEPLADHEGRVRVVSRPAAVGSGEAERYVLVVYCRLSRPEEDAVRIDFVKLNAPANGVLEPGLYTIDGEGRDPFAVGVVVSAPGYLDTGRDWQPQSGTLEIDSATATAAAGRFAVELRGRGAR